MTCKLVKELQVKTKSMYWQTSCNIFQLAETCWASAGGTVCWAFTLCIFSFEKGLVLLNFFIIHCFLFIFAVLRFSVEFGRCAESFVFAITFAIMTSFGDYPLIVSPVLRPAGRSEFRLLFSRQRQIKLFSSVSLRNVSPEEVYRLVTPPYKNCPHVDLNRWRNDSVHFSRSKAMLQCVFPKCVTFTCVRKQHTGIR